MAAGFMLLACAGCGGASEVAGNPPAHAAELKVEAPRLATPIAGAPLDRSQALVMLSAGADGGFEQPVAYAAGRVLLSVASTDPAAAQSFELWDPGSGAVTHAWTAAADRQDIVTAASGNWVATVRTGFDLPFAEWQLIVRNLVTSESRVLATGDPTLASDVGLHPDLPVGLAPYPSMSGDLVTWEEFTPANGHVAKAIKVANLATGTTTTVASAADAHAEDLRLPAIGGTRVAWIHRTFAESMTATIEWADVATGSTGSISVAGNPWAVGVTADGRYIAWDDDLQSKVVLDTQSGLRTRFAGAVGWGITTNGQQLSWSPAGAQGGVAGLYDPASGTVRTVRPADGARVNVGGLFGPWFAWQELMPATGTATYYFVPATAGTS